MADESSDLRFEERGDLRLDPVERQRKRLVPGHRPETLDGVLTRLIGAPSRSLRFLGQTRRGLAGVAEPPSGPRRT